MTDKNLALVQVHGVSPEAAPELRAAVGNAMLIAIGAAGMLSPKEMERFLAIAISYGAGPELTNAWRRFDYGNAKLADHFDGDARLARHMMYDAIRICRADGYGTRERARVMEAGRLLKVPPGLVSALEGIVEGEEALRNARIAIQAGAPREGAAAGVADGVRQIADAETELRKNRLSLMEEDKGIPVL